VEAVEAVAWVDADPAALAAARAALGLPAGACFPSLAAALAAVEVEAVLVTAPLRAHVPVALEALAAGKHVLVEKPFAPSLAEGRRAVAAAEAAGRVLMVSQNYRYFPAPRAVADLVRGGELGPVGAIGVDFRRGVTARSGSARHLALADPLLVDMAIHHFDLMRMVLGREPRWVACHTWNPPWSPFEGDAAGVATVGFDGGAVVSWRGSWVSPGPQTAWAGVWRVECEGGEIAWTSRGEGGGVAADRVTVRPTGGRARRLELPVVPLHGRAGALAAFAAAVRTGAAPESSGRANLGTLALAAAAVAAASGGGGPVPVEAGAGR
jgi:predicted dehydrogenase